MMSLRYNSNARSVPCIWLLPACSCRSLVLPEVCSWPDWQGRWHSPQQGSRGVDGQLPWLIHLPNPGDAHAPQLQSLNLCSAGFSFITRMPATNKACQLIWWCHNLLSDDDVEVRARGQDLRGLHLALKSQGHLWAALTVLHPASLIAQELSKTHHVEAMHAQLLMKKSRQSSNSCPMASGHMHPQLIAGLCS